MNLKVVLPVVVVIATVFGTVALLATGSRLNPVQPEAILTTVRIVEVLPEQVEMTVHSQGTAAPRTESDLVPEVSGKVVWISPKLVSGGSFEADETLLRIDDRDYKAAVGRARAALNRARAEDEHARYELQRLRSLEARQLASRSQMEDSLRTARIADANLHEARLVLEQAERDFARTEIRMPFAGLVRNEHVDVGQFVSRGNSIATVYATDLVEVRLPIADEQLAYLNIPLGHRGEFDEATAPRVTLHALYAGREYAWQARLVRTEAEIDAKSRMVHVVARVNNVDAAASDQPPLRVGQFVRADIEGRSVDAIVVLPRAAIRNDNQVLVVDAEDRLRYRDVRLMRVYRDKAFVTDGLEAGERVCVSPLQTVVEGMRVETIDTTQAEGPSSDSS
jgi:RND family efflux transporter MFP subunit